MDVKGDLNIDVGSLQAPEKDTSNEINEWHLEGALSIGHVEEDDDKHCFKSMEDTCRVKSGGNRDSLAKATEFFDEFVKQIGEEHRRLVMAFYGLYRLTRNNDAIIKALKGWNGDDKKQGAPELHKRFERMQDVIRRVTDLFLVKL